MLPKPPPRRPQLGFLYVPPYRIEGLSIAGEESSVAVPELGVCFDIGQAPKAILPCGYAALTHGHMDHAAGIAYYFSQRHFQGMGTGNVICPPALEQPLHNVMKAWVDVEAQQTPYILTPLGHDEEIEIKNNFYLRAFDTQHTVPSSGYVVVERRSKLKPEYQGLPQEKLVELKKQGTNITTMLQVPLVCYTGDTRMGDHLLREDVLGAQILITECTFVDPDHKKKAAVGQHMHITDVVELVKQSKADAVILTHLSRRSHIGQVRRWLEEAIPEEDKHRVHILMDGRTNRDRYEQQLAEEEMPT